MSQRYQIVQNIYENAGFYPWMVQDSVSGNPVKRKPFYAHYRAAVERARELNEMEERCQQMNRSNVVAIR